jgi:hypothetical protein
LFMSGMLGHLTSRITPRFVLCVVILKLQSNVITKHARGLPATVQWKVRVDLVHIGNYVIETKVAHAPKLITLK